MSNDVKKRYDISSDQEVLLTNAFLSMPSRDGWEEKFRTINEKISQTARFLFTVTPKSAEQTMALRKLQEAQYWFVEAIKKNEL